MRDWICILRSVRRFGYGMRGGETPHPTLPLGVKKRGVGPGWRVEFRQYRSSIS